MKFSKLVEFVSKKPIPPHTKHLVVEIMVSDEEGEDVEVCSLCFIIILTYSGIIIGSIHSSQDLSRHFWG